MYDERSIELDRVVFLLDIFLTIFTFLASFWGRSVLLARGSVDFFSHLFLIPLMLTLVIGFLSYFGAYQGPRYVSMASMHGPFSVLLPSASGYCLPFSLF
jgi:predicted membrane protein